MKFTNEQRIRSDLKRDLSTGHYERLRGDKAANMAIDEGYVISCIKKTAKKKEGDLLRGEGVSAHIELEIGRTLICDIQALNAHSYTAGYTMIGD